MSQENNIVDFWVRLAGSLTREEMTAYSRNGPIRRILMDSVIGKEYPPDAVEVGAMFAPLSLEISDFNRILLLDPVYKSIPFDDNFSLDNITVVPGDIKSELSKISSWLTGSAVLILENIINYLDLDIVYDLLDIRNFSKVIVGNNSTASFGDKHSHRLKSPAEINGALKKCGFVLELDIFRSHNTLVGIYTR